LPANKPIEPKESAAPWLAEADSNGIGLPLMKLYAQHGFGPGTKIKEGITAGLLDGVIISAKDVSTEQLGLQMNELRGIRDSIDILLDTQYYASILPDHEDNRLGNLATYPYWIETPQNDLYFLDPKNIEGDIRKCLEFQTELPVTSHIAPNIVVRGSLNSREGLIATSFLNETKRVAKEVGSSRKTFCTLALSREAILDSRELAHFVQLITSLPNPPDGIYFLLALSGAIQSETFHGDVIAGLLYLVSALKLNGFEVIVGYSDLMGPILATVGADAGASGWFATLRHFSLNRFAPGSGGGQPARSVYLSVSLFNRILLGELLAAVTLEPAVKNGISTDGSYFDENGVIEPETKTKECLQSWEALRKLHGLFTEGQENVRLIALMDHVRKAKVLYSSLRKQGVLFEAKSSDAHLDPILQGISDFQRSA
jgi:hypothetical protein